MTDELDPESWLDLAKIRSKVPKGNWRFNRILEEVDAALELGMLPSEYWAAPRQDQAYILARFRVKSTIQAYEDEVRKPKKKY